MVEGWLSTLSKCSAHLSRILSMSVMREDPSAVRGDDPDVCLAQTQTRFQLRSTKRAAGHWLRNSVNSFKSYGSMRHFCKTTRMPPSYIYTSIKETARPVTTTVEYPCLRAQATWPECYHDRTENGYAVSISRCPCNLCMGQREVLFQGFVWDNRRYLQCTPFPSCHAVGS